MAIFRIAGPTNQWTASAGILSATSESPSLPAKATQNTDRSFVWRSLNNSDNQILTLNRGVAVDATMMALANVDLQNAGTVKLQQAGAAVDPAAWTDVATFPTQDVDRRMTYLFFNNVNARHWRLQWVNGNPGTPDTAELGYAYLGTYVTLVPEAPTQIQDVDPSIQRSSVDGQTTHVRRTGYQAGEFLFKLFPESDLTILKNLRREYGARTPFFCVLDTAVVWQAWLLRFSSEIKVLRRDATGWYDTSFAWEESR